MKFSGLLTASALFVLFAAACGDDTEEKAPNSNTSIDAGSDASEIDAGNDDAGDDAGDDGACDPGFVENIGGECVVGDNLYLFLRIEPDGASGIMGFPITADLRTFEPAENEPINESCWRTVTPATPVAGPEPEEPARCWDIGLLTISTGGTEVDVSEGDECYNQVFNPRLPIDDPITFSFTGSSDFASGEFTMEPHEPPVVAVSELPDGTVEIERENPEAFETWALVFTGENDSFTCSGAETDVVTLSPDDIAEVGPLSDYTIDAYHIRVDGVGSSETDTAVLVSIFGQTRVELPAD